MSGENSQDRRMKEVWQSQPTEGVRMSVDQIRANAGRFQRRIQWRNVREYAASAVLVVFFTWEFWRVGDLLARSGFGLMIAGVLYLTWQLHSRGSAKMLPLEAGFSSSIEFLSQSETDAAAGSAVLRLRPIRGSALHSSGRRRLRRPSITSVGRTPSSTTTHISMESRARPGTTLCRIRLSSPEPPRRRRCTIDSVPLTGARNPSK